MLDNELIDRIYEASVVPELWPQLLANIAFAAGATDMHLTIVSPAGRNRWVTSSPDFEDVVRAHLEYFPANERTRRLLATRCSGFIVDSDVLTEAEMAAEPLYRDYLWPRGLGCGVATAIHAPTGDAAVLHAEGRRTDGSIPGSAVTRLDRLRPHFARAALLSGRLAMERAVGAVSALELMGLPAAVLGAGGRAIAANGSMAKLMPDVVQDRPSRLALADAAADRLLTQAVAVVDCAPHDAAVRSIPIKAQGERPPIIVHLTPIRGAAHDIFSRATAILVATPVVPRDVPTADVIQGLFDLTPSEAKLAALVAARHRPREAAQQLGWTHETTRTTLKRIMSKTGLSRQAELVALLSVI